MLNNEGKKLSVNKVESRCVVAVCGSMLVLIFSLLLGCGGGGDGGGGASYNCGDNNKEVIACIGDSITGEVNNGVPPYPSVLASLLPGKTIVNEGVGGEGSDGGAARIDGILGYYHPCYMLILYGANDVLHAYHLDASISNLRYILQTCKLHGTIPIIATLTPMAYRYTFFQPTVERYSAAIRTLAAEESVQLVDLAHEFQGSAEQLISIEDGLHPNAAGVNVMAMAFYEKVKP